MAAAELYLTRAVLEVIVLVACLASCSLLDNFSSRSLSELYLCFSYQQNISITSSFLKSIVICD